MTFGQMVGGTIVVLIVMYVGARLVTAAYFKSKQDHEAIRKVKS